MRKLTIFILQLLIFSTNIGGMTCPDDSIWTRSFASAKEIVDVYIPSKSNDCYMVWNSAEYLLTNKGKVSDMKLLLDVMPELSLEDPVLTSVVSQKKYVRLVDHYYFLKALKNGSSFEMARDGVTVDMRFQQLKSLNENDYKKLLDVFSSSNAVLHTLYLKKLPFLFQNQGCTEGLDRLHTLINKQVADSPDKKKVQTLYNQYRPLMKGQPAPLSVLKDPEGREHSFAEFKGKWLIIDVWATWCSSCLKKMPLFLKLSETYRNRGDIVFVTLSIDRKKAKSKWLNALEKYRMKTLMNLIPDLDHASPFEDAYYVSGVPRYIIIDKEGNIVTAFAPSPGDGLEEWIMKLLEI